VEECVQILEGLKSRFEEHHEVRYTHQALRTAAELSERYINDRHLPDKAIDVIDEAGANQRMQVPSKRKKTIGVKDIEAIVAKIARIPPKTVSSDDMEVLRSLERDLKLVIYGQDEAVNSLSAAIKLSRSGLSNEQKPIGSFLFAGPTGVGKTEVTRQLARILGIELIRFDMSEYMERHAVARLIGAPPGYVGYEEGGQLTEAVRRRPHAVILFDEIEKAHADVFNLLLQILDDGRLTDSHGRTVDFRNTVIIMTSNVGSQWIQELAGADRQELEKRVNDALRASFKPEFLNRIDEIIIFQSLTLDEIVNIVDIQIDRLGRRLADRIIDLILSDSAKALIARQGYDPVYGARPLKRVIQQYIENPLSIEILEGKISEGTRVRAEAEGDKIVFKIV